MVNILDADAVGDASFVGRRLERYLRKTDGTGST